jgi:transposase-like protein
LTAFFQTREQLAIQIATAGDSIRRVTKNYFMVKSQSGRGWYKVRKLQDADVWICDCADFLYRLSKESEKICKHILAVKSLQKTRQLENKIESPAPKPILCPKCSCAEHVKQGFRILKNQAKRQRYACARCKHRFIMREPGFSNMSATPQIISEALNLVFSGMSLRKTAHHLSMVHQDKVSYGSVLYWFKKYVNLMTEYVDTIFPEYHEVWSVDEMMINVKNTKPIPHMGNYDWMWSIINPQTKFVVASIISKRRESADAELLFKRGKKKQESDPRYVITDALHTYEPAFRNVFDQRRIAHIKTKSLSEGFANRPVERWHNEVRENIKARRGLGNDASAVHWADALRLNHNFIRPHSGLPNNQTPAEASDIDLGLGENKVKDLIVKSAEAQQQRKKEYNIEYQLGKRLKYVTIMRDADCTSVKPDSWIPKSFWREINDILFINGFSWVENGRDSKWLKLSGTSPIVTSQTSTSDLSKLNPSGVS